MFRIKKVFIHHPILCILFSLPGIIIMSAAAFPESDKDYMHAAKRGAFAEKLDFSESPYYIVIDKSDYELKIYDKIGWHSTYPIVFGSKDLSDKMREGDKRTPTGTFKIIVKKIHKKWGQELLLDYPNEESYRRFRARKAQGLIPANSSIGGGIAIHATRPGEEWTVDKYYNWTDGCVSVKYSEMKELFKLIPVGTVVKIQP